MFLRSLTLKGFKSFADTTTLALEPGITVVVGPNGSGKSNLVDAVAWVLGAQGPRTVRSAKMDDVIFAGTASRPALGRAEVSLTIDNSSGEVPVDLAEVAISRILFRSGESQYALNGASCRLLDLQDLLSDSGVGRTQHPIVGQGQLEAVLDSRPEDRRGVIEEAAGVLKFRRRKEAAERRLIATEDSLVRLGDLLSELRRQLRPLERQATAARRHGELVTELDALRRHLAGRDLAARTARLEASRSAQAALDAEDVAARQGLGRLDGEVAAAESELSGLGAPELADGLARLEGLRGRAGGLAAVLAERLRGIERERRAVIDEAVVASLEDEAARHRDELAAARQEADRLEPEVRCLAADEAELDEDRLAFAERSAGEDLMGAARRAARRRSELETERAGMVRDEMESERAAARRQQVAERASRLEAEVARLEASAGEVESQRAAVVAESAAATAGLAGLRVSVEEAESRSRRALADHHSWAARAEALSLARADARATAEAVAGVEGVVDALAALVEVDPGWEAPFQAAAGGAVRAVVVEGGLEVARTVVAALRDRGPARVLALGAVGPEPRDEPVPPVPGGEPVRRHVRGRRSGLEPVLDRLVGGAVCVGHPAGSGEPAWRAALDVAMAHPGAVVVTGSGDRFGPGPWRLGGAGEGAVGLALEEARQRASAAEAELGLAEQALGQARRELVAAEAGAVELARRASSIDARCQVVRAERSRAESDLAEGRAEVDAVQGRRTGLEAERDRQRARAEALDAELAATVGEEAAWDERLAARRGEAADLERREADLVGRHTELDVRAGAVEERRAWLSARLAGVEERLAGLASEAVQAKARRVELDRRRAATMALSGLVEQHAATLEAEVEELRRRRQAQSEAARETASRLEGLRRDRAGAERALEELRERVRRAELGAQEAELRVEAVVESVRRDLDCEGQAVLGAPCPPLDEGTTPAARARQLERELRLMGPVNPLALEEHAALEERHAFLDAELGDVRNARRELGKVIRAVDVEIVTAFSAAFEDVAANFAHLFEILFPGGEGQLRLTDPHDRLHTGVELGARPSGKSVRRLSLLSGGERALTALAFLFAVYRARPSPFYILDEVDAALDDVNLCRFLDLVGEFRREAQLLVVTHQKRTMEAGDVLYGVSAPPGGSSRVVSERVAART